MRYFLELTWIVTLGRILKCGHKHTYDGPAKGFKSGSYHFPPRTHSTVKDWYEAVNWNFDAFFPTRCKRFQTELIFHVLGRCASLSPTMSAFYLHPPLLITNAALLPLIFNFESNYVRFRRWRLGIHEKFPI